MSDEQNEPIKPSTPHCLCWIDLETTGLDPREDHVLEIAWGFTSFHYPYEPTICGGPSFVSHVLYQGLRETTRRLRERADETVQKMHEASGLWRDLDDCSLIGRSIGEVEEELLVLSDEWPEDKDAKVMIAGNSSGFDLGFLKVHMPTFAKRLSYRPFDASGFYRNCLSLGMPPLPKPVEEHRALPDLRRSRELALACGGWIRAQALGLRPGENGISYVAPCDTVARFGPDMRVFAERVVEDGGSICEGERVKVYGQVPFRMSGVRFEEKS